MASDEEIIKLWGSLPKGSKQAEIIISLYRAAEKEGRQEAILALEAGLLSDASIEAAMQTFGWGRKDKRSTITMRAVMREAIRLAKEKAESENKEK